jgi:hypothetical protein
MTRSFLWSARFALARGLEYSPAGAVLFWWITAGAGIGLVRLVRQDPKALRPPWQLVAGVAIGWLAMYFGLYVARLWGFNPLPH